MDIQTSFLARDLRNRGLEVAANRMEKLDLSANGLRILSIVREYGEAASSDIAERTVTTVYSASCQLKRLFERGYLDRSAQPQPSGEDEYIYTEAAS